MAETPKNNVNAGVGISIAQLLATEAGEKYYKWENVEYTGIKISSASLLSSGGIVINQVFNLLNGLDIHGFDKNTQIHLIFEAIRRAYRDHAEFMGYNNLVELPVARLTSLVYAEDLRQSIRKDKAIRAMP